MYAFYSGKQLSIKKIRNHRFFPQACCQYTTIFIERDSSSSIDGLYNVLRLVRGGRLGSQRHHVFLDYLIDDTAGIDIVLGTTHNSYEGSVYQKDNF